MSRDRFFHELRGIVYSIHLIYWYWSILFLFCAHVGHIQDEDLCTRYRSVAGVTELSNTFCTSKFPIWKNMVCRLSSVVRIFNLFIHERVGNFSAGSFITYIEHRYAVVLLGFSGHDATLSLMWSRDLCDWFLIYIFFNLSRSQIILMVYGLIKWLELMHFRVYWTKR
jgi:hypothetical protein